MRFVWYVVYVLTNELHSVGILVMIFMMHYEDVSSLQCLNSVQLCTGSYCTTNLLTFNFSSRFIILILCKLML